MSEPAVEARASHQLTRFLILRMLGLVYLGAFASLFVQLRPLLGHDGLLPVEDFLGRVLELTGGDRLRAARELPTLFWLDASDATLSAFAALGLALSLLLLAGLGNVPILLGLWLTYSSFVRVGQDWYSYGWETQLLETGFLAIFLVPLWDPRPFPARPCSPLVIGLFRWLIVRIMLGAGLIKLRGDPCWRELSCLDHHFETQPIPNPLTAYYHHAPRLVHQLGVLFNHLVELVAPVFAFGPRTARHLAGAAMLLFQLVLISSGNLSFLNWLTIVPILACFDDALLERVLHVTRPATSPPSRSGRIAAVALTVLVAALSVRPVENLLSSKQLMNTSYEPLALVNSYGAFGSVGRERDEIILEGSEDTTVTATTSWRPYELPCKPGDPARRPCVAGLFQWRLAWQIWFAAMGSVEDEPWMIHLVYRLLAADPLILSLVERDPFEGRRPRFVRAELYRYSLAPPGSDTTWTRERRGPWLPPLSIDDPRLLGAMEQLGWRRYHPPAADPP